MSMTNFQNPHAAGVHLGLKWRDAGFLSSANKTEILTKRLIDDRWLKVQIKEHRICPFYKERQATE